MSRSPDAPSHAWLLRAAEALGLSLAVVHPARLSDLPREQRPSLAVCRLPSGLPDGMLSGLLALERAGLPFLNRPGVLDRAHDKAAALAALAAAGLPVPPTVLVVRDGETALDGLPGERFVVKPLHGASGHGVTLGHSREAAARCATAFADASGPVIVQPLIGDGTDRRLFMLGARVVAACERRPSSVDGRGNLAYGARGAPIEASAEERAIARAAMDALDLDIAGVDLLAGPRGPVLLEVNTCPGLEGISRATGQDVAGAMVEFIAARVASIGGAR